MKRGFFFVAWLAAIIAGASVAAAQTARPAPSAAPAPRAGKNLFDPEKVTEGVEVFFNGAISAQPASSVSDFIPVAGQTFVTLSGLQPANGSPTSFYVFLAADRKTILGKGADLFPGQPNTLAIPQGAAWLRFSPRQRNANVANYSAVQVEYGKAATAFTPFHSTAADAPAADALGLKTGGAPPDATGKAFLIFGDDKTETAGVTDTKTPGGYVEGARENWPKYAMAELGAASWFNYAASGASFLEFPNSPRTRAFQSIAYQIQRAVLDKRAADVVIVSGGMNDQAYLASMPARMGSLLVAMQKERPEALDRTYVYEALRWVFWTIRTKWPKARCFAATPMQRADFLPDQQLRLSAAIKQVAEHYRCAVIDVNGESGVQAKFEVKGGMGRFLADGVSENPAGIQLMAKFMTGKLKAALAK